MLFVVAWSARLHLRRSADKVSPDLDGFEGMCCCHGATSGDAACDEGTVRMSVICQPEAYSSRNPVIPESCRHVEIPRVDDRGKQAYLSTTSRLIRLAAICRRCGRSRSIDATEIRM